MHLITYTGDGLTTEYDFSFPFFQISDVWVSVNSVVLSAGACTVVPIGAYVDGKYAGGRVVLTTAPDIGAEIRIWRKIDLSRTIDYQPTLPINTDCLNADFNFMLEYLRDLYELDGDVGNIENAIQFLDSIRAQIDALGGFSELARKSDLPDLTEYAKKSEIPDTDDFATKDEIPDTSNFATKSEIPDISNLATKDEIPDTSAFAPANHTHDMSAYATTSALNSAVTQLQNEIDDIDTSSSFPIDFDDNDEPDVVVKTQLPSASNNYTWYRKYKSGWVEQGGRGAAINNSAVTITLPVKMADTNYFPMMSNIVPANAVVGNYNGNGTVIVSTSQVKFATTATIPGFIWRVTGRAAQAE